MSAKLRVVNMPDFVNRINDVKRESGRSSEEMLKYVMILMLQAGRNATKLGKKNRKLVNGEITSGDDEGSVITRKSKWFDVYHQGSHLPAKQYLPRIPRKSKKNASKREEAIRARDAIIRRFKQINRRGIARASWGWAMWLLNQGKQLLMAGSVAVNEQPDVKSSKIVKVEKSLYGTKPYIQIINKLGWIRTIAPGIEARMIASADSRMKAWLEKRWQTGINRGERKSG